MQQSTQLHAACLTFRLNYGLLSYGSLTLGRSCAVLQWVYSVSLVRHGADMLMLKVCRSIRAIIDDSVELQYRIELTLDGMIDGPPSPVIVGDRLARLRALRRAWATLDWSSNIVVPMPGPCHAYELVGGVFCKTHHSQHHRFSSRHLTATWLPSSTDPAGRLIDREDIGLPTRDFAIDPSQDLIILFKGYEDDAMYVVMSPGCSMVGDVSIGQC